MRLLSATVCIIVMLAFAVAQPSRVGADDGGMCCVGGDSGQAPGAGASGEGGSSPAVTSWVIGAPGGGISRPPGTSSCTSWSPAANIDPDTRPADLATVKVDPDGITAILYYRDCGTRRQFVWIRQEPPETIATAALTDIRTQLLAPPQPHTSPTTRGIVNLETWLAVDDPGQHTVTASIPGISVTATAHAASTTWTFTGPHPPLDIICDGTGTAWTPDLDHQSAPCGHTFTHPTPPDTPLTVDVHITWHITWTATNATNGTLDPIDSNPTTFTYPIHEIHTIGTRG